MSAHFALMRAHDGLPAHDTVRKFAVADEAALLAELQEDLPGAGEVLVPLDAAATTMLLELTLVRRVPEEA